MGDRNPAGAGTVGARRPIQSVGGKAFPEGGSVAVSSFEARFKSKNKPQEVATPGTKRQKPVRPARAKRLLGAPFEFVAEVCQKTRGRATVLVAQCIYRRTVISGSQTITLPFGELAELGITRQRKQEALTTLETIGLIKVVNWSGRTARITLKWSLS